MDKTGPQTDRSTAAKDVTTERSSVIMVVVVHNSRQQNCSLSSSLRTSEVPFRANRRTELLDDNSIAQDSQGRSTCLDGCFLDSDQ